MATASEWRSQWLEASSVGLTVTIGYRHLLYNREKWRKAVWVADCCWTVSVSTWPPCCGCVELHSTAGLSSYTRQRVSSYTRQQVWSYTRRVWSYTRLRVCRAILDSDCRDTLDCECVELHSTVGDVRRPF